VGARKRLNGLEKNLGEEKSRRRVRAPGDKALTDQFETVGAVLASDWCQEISLQSQSSNTRSRFVFAYTKYTYPPVARRKLTEG